MTKDEILNRYHKEKDEGRLFIESKSLFKGFTMMMLVGLFLMVMSFLLTGEDTITNIIFILIMPFLICFYGIKGYYKKDKTYMIIAFIWLIIYAMRFFGLIKQLF